MGIVWQDPPEVVWSDGAARYAQAVHQGIAAICERWAPEIANWMKENAPWTDRTGAARAALYTEVEDLTGQMVRLSMAHGVSYGIYLELSNAGRYAIINPALDAFGPKIWADVVRMLS